jgi:hypothetical protein
LFIIPRNVCSTENYENQKSTAKHMAKEISSLGVHRLYVPDFCDGPSRPNARGAFFAATFSELLAQKAKGFAVVPDGSPVSVRTAFELFFYGRN